MSKILITGGTGFVGRHVVNRLLASGHTVRVLVRRTSDVQWLLTQGIEVTYGDLADGQSCQKALQDMEVLVNLATTMGGSREEVEVATIGGSRRLFAEAKQAGVRRLIHISSMGVLPMGAGARNQALPEGPLYETEERYLTSYVLGKIASEQAALASLADGGMEVTILRPGIVFGPGGSWKLSRLGTAVGPVFFLLGHARHALPVTYVENLADAVALAVSAQPGANGIFHIVEEEVFSAREFIEGYRRVVQPGMRIVALPRPVALLAGRVLGLVAKRLHRINPLHAGQLDGCMIPYRYDSSRARTVLGWQPAIGKAEALQRSYEAWSKKLQPVRRADLARLGTGGPPGPPTRVGLIGCGGIALQHLDFLRQIPRLAVVACYDPMDDRAERFAAQQGIPHSYRNLADMLAHENLQAVHVLIPPQSTREVAIQCLRAGCHVLVEKPMALDAAEVNEMQAEAARADRLLCVDHNHSYDEIMVEARRLLNAGALGEVIWMDSYYGFDLRANLGNPLLSRAGARNWNFQLPGGLFQNLLPHPLSLVVEFLPDPITVQAQARNFRLLPYQRTDELRLLLTTPGPGALVTVSLSASPKFQTLRIYGTRGVLELDFTYKLIRWHRHIPGIPRALQKLGSNIWWGQRIVSRNLKMAWQYANKTWIHYDGMQRLIAEFHICARAGLPPPIPQLETLRVMQIMDETWRQVGSQRVTPPD